MATVFVEILDRRGKVAERIRLRKLPATIGRSYSSTVIVDDIFVSPSHLRLEASDDEISVVDISDANGLIDGKSGQRVSSLTLASETVAQIGSTMLRFRTEAYGSEPARPFPGGSTLTPRGWIHHLKTAVLTIFCLGFLAFLSFLETARETTPADSLEEVFGWSFLLFLWTGSWAFASNALAQESFFGRHLKIACLALIAFPLWDTALSYTAFLLSFDSRPSTTSTIGATVISIIAIYRHFSLVSRQNKRRRRLIAGCLAFLALIGVVISEVASRDDFQWFPNHLGALEPIPPRFLPSHSPERLFSSMEELRQHVDELAAEEED